MYANDTNDTITLDARWTRSGRDARRPTRRLHRRLTDIVGEADSGGGGGGSVAACMPRGGQLMLAGQVKMY